MGAEYCNALHLCVHGCASVFIRSPETADKNTEKTACLKSVCYQKQFTNQFRFHRMLPWVYSLGCQVHCR